MKKRCTIFIVPLLLLLFNWQSMAAETGVIASWNFYNNADAPAKTPDQTAAGANVSNAALGEGLVANDYMSHGLTGRGQTSTSLSGAINENDYFGFTITPDAGSSVSVTSVEIRPVSQNKERTFVLLSSKNGFTDANIIGSFTAHAHSGGNIESISIGGHNDITDPLEFRVYVYTPVNPNQWEAVGCGNSAAEEMDLIVNGSVNQAETTYALTVNNGTGSGNYTEGAEVGISANEAPDGKQFSEWTGDVAIVTDVNSSSTVITMPASDATVTASYEDIPDGDGVVISNISKSTYLTGVLTAGNEYYVDRNYTLTGIPANMEGLQMIMPANDDKNQTAVPYWSFDVSEATTVFVAYDSRATSLPDWMSSYTATGNQINTTDVPLDVYALDVQAGTVEMGANRAQGSAGAGTNYLTIVDGQAGDTPVTYQLGVFATNGSIAKNPDKSAYDAGETVEITAIPDPGYLFDSWSGDVSGSDNPASIMMDADKSVTANFIIEPEETDNLLSNGEFDNGKTSWTSQFQNGATGSLSIVPDAGMSGDNAAQVAITDGGTSNWNVELFSLFNMESGKTYDISFQAKAESNRSALLALQKNTDPWSHYWQQSINIQTTPQTFTFSWTADVTDANTRVNFKLGADNSDVWIDNVVVKENVDGEDPDELSVSPESLSFGSSAGTKNLGVTSNISWNVSSNSSWISLSASSGSNNGSFDVTASANNNTSSRSGTITVEGAGISRSISVYQSGQSAYEPGDDKKIASINLHWVKDWLPPILADVFQTNRDWEKPAGGPANLDQNGWPTEDAVTTLWHGHTHKSGTYKLRFTGKADLIIHWSTNQVSVQNKSYDASSNTSTADLVVSEPIGLLRLEFSNTNGGVKNVKMMRPVAEGSSQAHGFDEVTDREMIEIISKFKVVRYMDPSNTNSNPETTWSDRQLPGMGRINKGLFNPYKGYEGDYTATGVPWEYIVTISNETNTDPWINLPAMADDQYYENVAKLFKYGSDGVNPYNSPQANPVWPPLNNDLDLYVEYSNEVWNSGTGFVQHHYNHAVAISSVKNNLDHPLNYDNLVTSSAEADSKGYDLAKRRVGYKGAELSKIFRNVFGDDQMMERVRPLFAWQISNGGFNSWGHTGLKFVEDYYAQTEGNPVNYYFWGGGPAGYYSPTDDATIDNLWDSHNMNPETWANHRMDFDGTMCAAMGIKFVLYEGGPGFGDAKGGDAEQAVGEEAWNDPRIYNEMDEHHKAYNQKGGDLFCYYVLHHDFRWTFMEEGTMNDDTYKMYYMEDMQLQDKEPVNVGYDVPGSIKGGQFEIHSTNWKSNHGDPDQNYKLEKGGWIAYRILSQQNASYNVTIDYMSSAASEIQVFAGGILIGTINIADTNNGIVTSEILTFSMPAQKLYGLRLKNTGTSDVTIETIDVSLKSENKNAQLGKKPETQPTPIKIYPNPAQNTVYIEAENEQVSVDIYNMSGSKVISSQNNRIDVSSLPAGVYFVMVNGERYKLIKN